MSFNIKTCELFSEGKTIPLFKPTDVLVDKDEICCGNVTFNRKKFTRKDDYTKAKENTWKLCWKYFVAGYQCYCLSKEAWPSERLSSQFGNVSVFFSFPLKTYKTLKLIAHSLAWNQNTIMYATGRDLH